MIVSGAGQDAAIPGSQSLVASAIAFAAIFCQSGKRDSRSGTRQERSHPVQSSHSLICSLCTQAEHRDVAGIIHVTVAHHLFGRIRRIGGRGLTAEAETFVGSQLEEWI